MIFEGMLVFLLRGIMIFHVTMQHAEDGWIVVECPALPGCVSQGRDEKEALENVKEAINAWLWAEDQKAVSKLKGDRDALSIRKLGILSNSQMELIVKEGEITIRPLKRVSELAGVLSRYTRPGGAEHWDTIREQTEAAIAEEVVDDGSNRVRGGR